MPRPDRPGPARGAARTKATLLAAAAQLFSELGVRGSSVDAICRRAGVTKGAFYHSFTGKADLIAEVGRSISFTVGDHPAAGGENEPHESLAVGARQLARDTLAHQESLLLFFSLMEDLLHDPADSVGLREPILGNARQFAETLENRFGLALDQDQAIALQASILGLLLLRQLAGADLVTENVFVVVAEALTGSAGCVRQP